MRILQTILELVFPTRCIGCGETADAGGLCARCAGAIREIAGDVCPTCGQEVCVCNPARPPAYRRLIGAYYYDEVKGGIHAFKFQGRAGLAVPFSQAMVRQIAKRYSDISFDAVVAVPMHPRKERERGYNQADLLAREIARALNVPLLFHLLRHRPGEEQHLAQNPAERWARVGEAIEADRIERANGKRILLVDDVSTTGATLDACAKLLVEGGASEVYCVTIALTRKVQN